MLQIMRSSKIRRIFFECETRTCKNLLVNNNNVVNVLGSLVPNKVSGMGMVQKNKLM